MELFSMLYCWSQPYVMAVPVEILRFSASWPIDGSGIGALQERANAPRKTRLIRDSNYSIAERIERRELEQRGYHEATDEHKWTMDGNAKERAHERRYQ